MTPVAPGLQRFAAVHSMDALGALTGGIAHDLNNLLTALQGYLELVNSSVDAGDLNDLSQHSGELQSGLNRAAGIVREMMNFGRRPRFEPQPIQISPLIAGTVTLLRAALPSRISVVHEQTGVDAVVVADPSLLRQILLNLGAGSLAVMGSVGGTLTISVDLVNTCGDENTGAGDERISISFTNRARDRDESGGREPAPGSGDDSLETGFSPRLALVRELASEVGGWTVTDGGGSPGDTVRVVLPAENVEKPASKPAAATEDSAFVPARVLFVDDEEPITQLGAMSLERLGHTVTGCTDAKAALELFAQAPDRFDLVVTDQMLPELLGHELAGEIRRVRPDMPIVIATGTSEDYTRDHAEAAGYRYLAKPYTLDQLGAVVSRSLAS